jgi:hypothetical protein
MLRSECLKIHFCRKWSWGAALMWWNTFTQINHHNSPPPIGVRNAVFGTLHFASITRWMQWSWCGMYSFASTICFCNASAVRWRLLPHACVWIGRESNALLNVTKNHARWHVREKWCLVCMQIWRGFTTKKYIWPLHNCDHNNFPQCNCKWA